jgi:hypothetical protein
MIGNTLVAFVILFSACLIHTFSCFVGVYPGTHWVAFGAGVLGSAAIYHIEKGYPISAGIAIFLNMIISIKAWL